MAVVGLGPLGLALGRHLSHLVPRVCGVDHEPSRRCAWQALTGAEPTAAVADLPPEVAAVFVVVGHPDQVHAILEELDADGRLGPGLPVFVLTTLTAEEAERVISTTRRSIVAWPVPVSGGEVAALRGRLLAIVPAAMPAANVELLRQTIAPVIVTLPGADDCATAKLLANGLIAYQFAALGAILEMGAQSGLELRTLFDALRMSSAAGGALDAARHYSVTSLRKDLAALGQELPAVSAADGPGALEHLQQLFVG